jgi:hypothetical protein
MTLKPHPVLPVFAYNKPAGSLGNVHVREVTLGAFVMGQGCSAPMGPMVTDAAPEAKTSGLASAIVNWPGVLALTAAGV